MCLFDSSGSGSRFSGSFGSSKFTGYRFYHLVEEKEEAQKENILWANQIYFYTPLASTESINIKLILVS